MAQSRLRLSVIQSGRLTFLSEYVVAVGITQDAVAAAAANGHQTVTQTAKKITVRMRVSVGDSTRRVTGRLLR